MKSSAPKLATLALILFAGQAEAAPVTAADASCRARIQLAASRLGGAANKTIDRCMKDAFKDFVDRDCNSLAVADTKAKVSAAEAKLADGMASKCTLPDNAAALAEFPRCPSPADADDGGDGVQTFTELAACEATLNTDGIEALRGYVLAPDEAAVAAHPNAANIRKCMNAIGKQVTKAWAGAAKARGKAQVAADKAGGDYDYTGDATSTAAIESACSSAIQSMCGALTGVQLGVLHSCAGTAAGIAQCACRAAVRNANGATASAFNFDGICPSELVMGVNSGGGPNGVVTNTSLDLGWTGLGHEMDLAGGFTVGVDLACSDATCGDCAVTMNCDRGNCRCSKAPATACSVPFVTGGPCGTGTCDMLFGPPLPLGVGGSPMCLLNRMKSAAAGSMDAGTGESNIALDATGTVALGITQTQPCPICVGGTCQGGANNGAACSVDAVHPDFGPVSYDCWPSVGTDISPPILNLAVTLTDGAVSLPFADPCDAPLGSLNCACGVCSGDNKSPCEVDADCATLALGTCTKGAAGPSRMPNRCDDLTCEPVAGSGSTLGVCSGETEKFCSGVVRKNGDGVITCFDDTDCTALSSECPNSNCGTCTLEQPRRCFLDPVIADGIASSDGAELVSTFCIPSGSSSGINAASGWPGPGRARLDVDFTSYCADGTTEYEAGGSNCP